MARARHRMSGSVRRTALIYGSALVVVAASAGFLVAKVRSDQTGSPPHAYLFSPSPTPAAVPEFAFTLKGVHPIATGKKEGAMAAAELAAGSIQDTLDRLYLAAFLDPGSWGNGQYRSMWNLFSRDAVATAHVDTDTLTLGRRAGSTFVSVAPHGAQLAVQVLMDRLGHPTTAVAIVKFSARGTDLDGSETVIRSSGQYFLRPGPGEWRIYGYDVRRDDGDPSPPSSSGAAGDTGATP